eukprot:TRINITY_DN12374_c0_g2_i4.p1 TRINITY_DN12374_c0_g2~~TRINITY_DN12374_c0_g2_i4.p1  ORF type:complete len:266 (+),score=61.36 TRINITY_DN12374_c0_g2_i4:34-831(+)
MTCTERRTGYAQADYTLGLQDRTDSGETTADLPSQFSVGSSIDSVGSLKGEEESAEADEPEAALGQTTETCLVQSNVVESDAKLKATAATASGADVPMPSPAAAAAQASASPGAPVLKLPAARPPPPSCPPPPPPPPPPLRKSAAQSATAVGATAADDTEAAVADAGASSSSSSSSSKRAAARGPTTCRSRSAATSSGSTSSRAASSSQEEAVQHGSCHRNSHCELSGFGRMYPHGQRPQQLHHRWHWHDRRFRLECTAVWRQRR